ncbi:MAG: hypothetical protein DMD35_02095 [Gemmatimonadetes bacterium]|nr:MAG: hypothetical protein DMD35_02095 [Gemmatimonadota bacterium]
MQWDGSENAGFFSASMSRICILHDPDSKRPTVATQRTDPNSRLSYVRQLLSIRASPEATRASGSF